MRKDLFVNYNLVKPPEIEIPEKQVVYPFTNNFINYVQESTVEELNPKLDVEPEEQQIVKKQESVKQYKGSKSFELALDEAAKINPNVNKYRNFLVRTAKRESNFTSNIKNSAGAPCYGYFQMLDTNIKAFTGLSVNQFLNNPVAQILGAVKLYDANLNSLKKSGAYKLGKNQGYSDDAMVTGAWLAGPKGVEKFLKGLSDPSDSHWYKGGKGGTSVSKLMNNW